MLRVKEAQRYLLVFLAQQPEGTLLSEAEIRRLETRMRLTRVETQRLVAHMMKVGVVEYVGPNFYDVRLTDAGRAAA